MLQCAAVYYNKYLCLESQTKWGVCDCGACVNKESVHEPFAILSIQHTT